MKQIHMIALAAASAALLTLGTGVAAAQTVSGGDAYQQGYAAGAASQDRNSFNTYDQGLQAGAAAQSNADSRQAFNNGYQAGMTQAKQANEDSQQAYNQGYQDRAQQDQDETASAFDRGYDTGSSHQAREDADYP